MLGLDWCGSVRRPEGASVRERADGCAPQTPKANHSRARANGYHPNRRGGTYFPAEAFLARLVISLVDLAAGVT